jgi:hypothetical protein
MIPQVAVQTSPAGTATLLTSRPAAGYSDLGSYSFTYGSNIHLYGISLTKQVAGLSVGSELSYRTNMPLVSDPAVLVLPTSFASFTRVIPGSTTTMPTTGDAVGAVGDTMHGVVNVLGVLPGTAAFDTATWAVEGAWSHLSAGPKNKELDLGRSFNLGPFDVFRATRNAGTLAFTFTPTWNNVAPSVDLSAPMSIGWGVFGNSPVSLGGNKNVGNYGAGISALIRQAYTVTLQYTGNMGQLRYTSSGVVGNGQGSYLLDRGTIYLTAKTTF